MRAGRYNMSETSKGDEPKPEARYANYFRIGFNAWEFVIDFGQEYSPDREQIHTRIVTSTPLARNLSETLERSLHEHDDQFGKPETSE